MITRLKNSDFFPYSTYRNEQQKIIDEIEHLIRNRHNILLNGPNGTGKCEFIEDELVLEDIE